ncbi:MAG: LPS export ABC transporter periplasmic protein LptC, partial [Planctomycetes bacterium]|nr:LPS export ABC transporter periplasmic protein LptC [Planctomycetota bacterium]
MIIRLRRVLLVGVILVCLVTLALAMTGHFKPPAPPEPPRAQPGESPVHKGKLDFESQHFREFNLPRTDETGRRESIIEGEYAILQKNRYYEITQPRITVFGSPKTKAGDPQAVIITAHKATLDKITQAGTLEGGVVMQEAVPDGQSALPKPDGTRAATDKLDYIPERKRVATDSPVALTSKGIRVNGRGLEADTVAETITLKHDVEVELEGVEGGFFAAAQGKPGGRKPRPPKPGPPDLVRIACGGSLLYQRGPNVATFSDGVKATRGESSLTSDQMVVFIDAQTRKVSKLDATGNVKVVDAAQQGAGAKLNWDAQAQTGLLAGDPARLFMKGTTLEAKKITFNQKENKITTEGGGHLVATAKPPASAGQKPSAKTPADDKVDVVWQGNMIFDGARHTAVFYDAVQLTRATGKLDCQRLELVLDEQHEQVKKLVATDKVRMVDADKEAEGDELLWNADDQTGVLSSRSAARVKQGNVSLSAQRMNLDERNSNLTTQGGG